MLWYIIAFIIPAIAVFLQVAFQAYVDINSVAPDLVLICLLYYANSRTQKYGQFIGLQVGILIDLLSALPLGFFSFIYTITGYIAGLTTKKLYSSLLMVPVFMTASGFLINSLSAFFLSIILNTTNKLQIFSRIFLTQMLYTILLSPFIFFLLRSIDRLLSHQQFRRYQK